MHRLGNALAVLAAIVAAVAALSWWSGRCRDRTRREPDWDPDGDIPAAGPALRAARLCAWLAPIAAVVDGLFLCCSLANERRGDAADPPIILAVLLGSVAGACLLLVGGVRVRRGLSAEASAVPGGLLVAAVGGFTSAVPRVIAFAIMVQTLSSSGLRVGWSPEALGIAMAFGILLIPGFTGVLCTLSWARFHRIYGALASRGDRDQR